MRIKKISLFHTKELAFWVIRGAEGEDDGGDDKSGDDKSSDKTDEDESGGDDKSDDAGDDGDDEEDDSKGDLKGALKKERENAKKATKDLKVAQRELKKLQTAAAEKDAGDKDAVTKATSEATKAQNKVAALATKLRDTAVENAVSKAARTLGFRDADDVMAVLARNNFKDLDIDQDEDNPAEIDIDEDSIKTALKALAKKKPHWLIADGEEEPSGGRFNGGTKPPKKTTEEGYREKYSALRR